MPHYKVNTWGEKRDTACKTTLLLTNKNMWAIKNKGRSLDYFLKENLQQALSLQILVGLLIDHVAARVLVLLLENTRVMSRVRTHRLGRLPTTRPRGLTSVSGCHRSRAFWDFSFAHTAATNTNQVRTTVFVIKSSVGKLQFQRCWRARLP